MFVGRYVKYFGRWPRLRRPRTFTKKLLVRLLFDRNPQLTFFADKVTVREYVAARLGGTEHSPPSTRSSTSRSRSATSSCQSSL